MTFIVSLTRLTAVACTALLASQAAALPEIDEPTSLSGGGATIEVVPDSEDPNKFYIFPIGLEFTRDGDGIPNASFQHWGISKPDQEGSGANITFGIKPVFDVETRDKVLEALHQNNPSISIAQIPIERSYYDVVITDNFASDPTYVTPAQLIDTYTKDNIKYMASLGEQGIQVTNFGAEPVAPNVLESIQGGPGNAPFATTFKLSSLAGRLAGEFNPEVESQEFFAVRYRYMVRGVTPKFRVELKVNWKKTFEHFQARFGGGFWFWRSSHVVDIQEMKQSGAIELKITDGGIDESTQALVDKVFETLVNARINGSGMFAPQLKPGIGATAAGSPGGSIFGWSFNSNSSFQKLTEEVNQDFIIDSRDIVSRSYSLGIPFGLQCTSFPQKFQNLSDPGEPCLTPEMIESARTRVLTCISKDIAEEWAAAEALSEPFRTRQLERLEKFCGA
ncbi:hypothetical protein [Primorskyibacter sp. 2E233]|uniref:hypothetical protein n=1 Tax=Primorskyibacter sp. 2E233 TaxID=3413431 RepID=UPI003BEF93FD